MIWNEFVAASKNATFLFHRDFMEYHQNRFEDYSLLIFKDKTLVALLPANKVGDTVYSHKGLTYGGLILEAKTKFRDVLEAFKTLLKWMHANAVNHFELKFLPAIYAKNPNDELSYVVFKGQGKLIRRDILSVLHPKDLKLSRDRKNGVKRAVKLGLVIKETQDFDLFWNQILIPNLKRKHNAKPVHTLEEITYLKSKFPMQIRQFNVYLDGEIVAGTTIFESDNVAHSQYISGNSKKNILGSLDILHHFLLTEVFDDKAYFDFGISNENQGQNINEGLLYWKEGFGARSQTQSFYRLETKNYINLENVML
ncbi:MAG: GNAT family N-acetyltransferase [Flavobacteriaceae bacterium]|nr:GNAT family N-acetyltransferase [Flavobacteriaceae bacterium]